MSLYPMDDDEQHFHPRGLTFTPDVAAARWIEQRLGKKFAHVEALVPRGFARYARLFHPAKDRYGARLRWADVAAQNGRTVHPLMAFERISIPAGGSAIEEAQWIEEPRVGSLDPDDVIALADCLGHFTGTSQRCFFAIWEGYGQFSPGACIAMFSASEVTPNVARPRLLIPPAAVLTAQRLVGVGRKYLLYSGPLSAIASFHANLWDSPNLWWPEDRNWCVATDIDLNSTYLGGSEDCIEALCSDSRFEVLPTVLDARVDFAADTVNIDTTER
jgi:hypothetical protein